MQDIAMHDKQLLTSNPADELAAINFGYVQLALEVLNMAVEDVQRNPSLQECEDALDFLRTDGPLWMSVTGYGIRPSEWDNLLSRLTETFDQRCRQDQVSRFVKSLIRTLRNTFNQTQQPIGD